MYFNKIIVQMILEMQINGLISRQPGLRTGWLRATICSQEAIRPAAFEAGTRIK